MPDLLNSSDHRFMRMVVESVNFQDQQRRLANSAFDFRDGKQWTDDEVAQMEEMLQCPSVINVTFSLINALSAVELRRRTDYTFVGKEAEDKRMGIIATALLKEVMDNNNVNYFVSKAFAEGATSGIAWFEVHTEFDHDLEEDVVAVTKHKWEEFYYDPFAKRPDKSDARYIARQVWLDKDVAKEMHPGHAQDIDDLFSLVEDNEFFGQEWAAKRSSVSRFIDVKDQRIAIFEMYYKDAIGKIGYVSFSHDIFFEGSEDGTTDGDNKSPYESNFYPFIPFVALEDKEGRPMGIIEFIKTMQQSINKAHSKHMFNIASNRVLFESDTFKDPLEAKAEFNKPNTFLETNEGALAGKKLMILNNLQESQHLMEMQAFLISQMQRVVGVNDAIQGIGGNNARSFAQESARINQGTNLQSPMLENLYFTKRAIAKTILKVISERYTKRRVVRITNVDGESDFEIINNNENPKQNIGSHLRYDLVIREEPVFNSMDDLTARSLNEIVQVAPQTLPAVIPELANTLPHIKDPDRLVRGIRETFQQQPQR